MPGDRPTDCGKQRTSSGKGSRVGIELGLDDRDHLISSEERLDVAVAIQ